MNILLDTWATTMWRACWQGGLVVLVVWSICRLIPSMPARFQCWLWRGSTGPQAWYLSLE